MYVPTVLPTVGSVKHPLLAYRGDLKLRTRTAIGPYGRAMPRSIGSPWGRCVSLLSSNPCIQEIPSREDRDLGFGELELVGRGYRGYSKLRTHTAPRVVVCS